MKKPHNRKYYVLGGIIVFMLLISSMCIYIIMPRGRPLEIKKASALFGIVKDGDIICRLGDRLWSDIFSDLSIADKRYSHMGIIHISNGIITVIHAEGSTGHGMDFVSEVPLDNFLQVARRIGIYRINNIAGHEITQAALEYTGVPFDWQFDMDDDSKLYCTELLHVILKRIMPETKLDTVYFKTLGKKIIPLEAVSDSEYFSEIYYFDGIK
ncbi:MAG: hypothetical protein FWG27_02880 [Treponema sp.]|jgi:hypothetical protein|nr:hypothetical protein [Treponema sp.]